MRFLKYFPWLCPHNESEFKWDKKRVFVDNSGWMVIITPYETICTKCGTNLGTGCKYEGEAMEQAVCIKCEGRGWVVKDDGSVEDCRRCKQFDI